MYMIIATAFLVTIMAASGLRSESRGLQRELRSNAGLIGRVLIANFILVPLAGWILVRIFSLAPQAETGLMLLAILPGAPMMIKFTGKIRERSSFAVILLIILSSAAVLITPPAAKLLLTPAADVSFPSGRAAGFLVIFMLVPLLIGMVIKKFAGRSAVFMEKSLTVAATLLFALFVAFTLQLKSGALARVGLPGAAAALLLALAGLGLGWISAGPDHVARMVSALATSMRNVAIGLAIVTNFLPGTDAETMIVVFSALILPVNFLFLFFNKRYGRKNKKLLPARQTQRASESTSAK